MMTRQDTYNLFLARLNGLKLHVETVYRPFLMQIAYEGHSYTAVILPSSHEYWTRRYHLATHPPTLILCYEHNTCVNVAVFCLRTGTFYQPCTFPPGMAEDYSDRITVRGKQVFLGALLCGIDTALSTLDEIPRSTKYRYLHDLKLLRRKKRGRPVEGKEENYGTSSSLDHSGDRAY